VKSAAGGLLDTEVKFKEYLRNPTGKTPTVVCEPVKPNDFDNVDHVAVSSYVVKVLDKDHEV
jgi:hypothetical protein